MPSAPYDLSISAAQADALFASPLQRSDEPSAAGPAGDRHGPRRVRRAGLRRGPRRTTAIPPKPR